MAFLPDAPYPKSPGDDIRAKDWNDLVETLRRLENILTVLPGNIRQGAATGTPISGTLAKIAELTAMRPGTYRVVTYHTNPAASYGQLTACGIVSRVYVNDIESPQSSQYQLTTPGTRVQRGIDTITVAAGDKIQLYARKNLPNNPATGVIGEIEICIGNPLSPAVV